MPGELRVMERDLTELEGRAAFGGFIGPLRLVDQVRTTEPWLFDGNAHCPVDPPTVGERLWQHAEHPLGWLAVLRRHRTVTATETPTVEQLTDYFALCVACHFTSCASWVPTDVDTKIRAHLWFMPREEAEREAMVRVALATLTWDLRPVSTRHIATEHGFISGHGGECLSVILGGMLAMQKAGDVERARILHESAMAELVREAAGFESVLATRGRELDVLKLAAAITHNAGDVDQGLSAEFGTKFGLSERPLYAKLAHGGNERFGGSFARAANIYKTLMASEGHRNYPLREIRPLRKDPRLLFPIAPFLDEWGELLARFDGFNDADRAEIAGGLLTAPRRVTGQQGYYRALAGLNAGLNGGLESSAIVSRLGSAAKKALKDTELRKLMAVPRQSFESSMKKKLLALL